MMSIPASDIWSCDPKDIPPWTPEDKARLTEALSKVFNWEDSKNDEKSE